MAIIIAQKKRTVVETNVQLKAVISEIDRNYHSPTKPAQLDFSSSFSTEGDIKAQIAKLDKQKISSNPHDPNIYSVVRGNKSYSVNTATTKTLNKYTSYQQRVYVYAGAACMLLDQLESEESKVNIKAALKALADAECKRFSAKPCSDGEYKKRLELYLAEVCRLLGEKASYQNRPIGVNQAAAWLTKMEHFYVASLGTADQISRYTVNKQSFYHVIEYLPGAWHILAEELSRVNKPLWFKNLTPPEQNYLTKIVANGDWEKLSFMPSTLDRIPGLRNFRVTKLFMMQGEEPKLIDTIYASGARVPNGIKDSSERQRLAKVSATEMHRQLPAEKDIFAVSLLSRLGPVEQFLHSLGLINDTVMVDEQHAATQPLNNHGRMLYQANVPVNKLNILATDEGWQEIKRIKARVRPDMPNYRIAQLLIQYLDEIQRLSFVNPQKILGLNSITRPDALVFAAAYAGLLAKLVGIQTIFNCKSGKDRTGLIEAIQLTLLTNLAAGRGLLDYKDLMANREPAKDYFLEAFCPIYVQNARAAGNNSFGCDDLKLGTIALPSFLTERLKQMQFVGSGIANMNRPKPRLGFLEKTKAAIKGLWFKGLDWFTRTPKILPQVADEERVPLLSKERLSVVEQPLEIEKSLQIEAVASNQEEVKQDIKLEITKKTLGIQEIIARDAQHIVNLHKSFIEPFSQFLDDDQPNSTILRRMITTLATCGLRAKTEPNTCLAEYLTGDIQFTFSDKHTTAEFINFLAGKELMTPVSLPNYLNSSQSIPFSLGEDCQASLNIKVDSVHGITVKFEFPENIQNLLRVKQAKQIFISVNEVKCLINNTFHYQGDMLNKPPINASVQDKFSASSSQTSFAPVKLRPYEQDLVIPVNGIEHDEQDIYRTTSIRT